MGTSYVEYKGYGFWSRDSFLECWITTLLDQMQRPPALEPWQESLAEHWRIQAYIDGGCMSLNLDGFLSDSTRREIVLSVSEQALPRCPELGRRTGELFIALLSGLLRTTASSPIDYL